MKNHIREFSFNSVIDEELIEMANLSPKITGIENTAIWVGPIPKSHGMRIKISNVPNKFDGKNCFTLTIPNFKVEGYRDIKHITDDKLNSIEIWVNKHIKAIEDFSSYKIGTDEFIEMIKS